MSRWQTWSAVAPVIAGVCPAATPERFAAWARWAAAGREVSMSETCCCWQVRLPLAAGETTGYLKRYRFAGHCLRYLGRPGRTMVEWRNYHEWPRLGLPGPEPWAAGERRQWGTFQEGWILTRGIPGTLNLAEVMRTRTFASLGAAGEILVGQVADLAARAHRAGFFHRDLKVRNLLVRLADGDAPPEVWWIDCPRGGFFPAFRRGLAVADLADLGYGLRKWLPPAVWARLLARHAAGSGLHGLAAAVKARVDRGEG
ncbi:MAG: lipopolysaccharide kinase InaA family protein [bacterium]